MKSPDRLRHPLYGQIKRADRAVRRQVEKLDTLHGHLMTTLEQWSQVSWSNRGEVYKNPPLILEAVSQWSIFDQELGVAKGIFDDTGLSTAADQYMSMNPLSRKVNGTSLNDISNMPLPLSTADIRKIDLTSRQIRNPHGSEIYIQDIVGLAATQAELYPSRNLPPPTKQLIQRLRNYWEYYTVWALSSKQNSNFLGRMMSEDHLLQGLLAFIPARLHISPASTYRLFDAHIENAGPINRHLLHRFGYPRFLNYVASFLKDIPNPKGLLATMADYQYTDAQAESELTKRLNQSYKDKTIKIESESALRDETRTLAQQLSSLHHKDLRQAIRASGEGFIRLSPEPDSFFKEILVGLLYGKTLSIAGLLEGGESFVTADLIQSGRLFGIPSQIAKRNPVLARLLMRDLMTPLLEATRARNHINVAKPSLTYAPLHVISEIAASEDTAKLPKRRTLRAIQFITQNPKRPKLSTDSLPQEEQENNNYSLIYKGQIVTGCDITAFATSIAKDLLPNDQRLPNDIKLIIESLTEDPYGPGTYKIADATPVVENGYRMPQRSFRGDTRRLPFQNKAYSDKLRTVFYIDPKSRSITLIKTVTHDKFDNEFTTGKNH